MQRNSDVILWQREVTGKASRNHINMNDEDHCSRDLEDSYKAGRVWEKAMVDMKRARDNKTGKAAVVRR